MATEQTAKAAPPPPRGTQGTVTALRRGDLGYFATIMRSARSILEGMAVTFAVMRRPAITVQYPDRVDRPVQDTLPERSRGLLEVDVLCCTGCQACARQCPIDVIRMSVVKDGALRFIDRFDIDLGKCMYCGFCVDACPVTARAPGDKETTCAIRFTREFEGTVEDYNAMTYRYIRSGDRVVVAKNKKGQVHDTAPRGQRAREARKLAVLEVAPLVARNRRLRAQDPMAGRKADVEQAFQIPVDKAAKGEKKDG